MVLTLFRMFQTTLRENHLFLKFYVYLTIFWMDCSFPYFPFDVELFTK